MVTGMLEQSQERNAAASAIEHALMYGLTCACGREAGQADIDVYVDELEAGDGDVVWSCPEAHLCGECRGAGAPKGAHEGAVCPSCAGEGEVPS